MAAVEQYIEPEPWLRMEGDTDPSFNAFVLYRDMGSVRSLAAVQLKLGMSDPSTLRAWSRENGWRWRVEAYDRHVDEVKVKAHLDAVAAMEQRHVTLAQGALQALTMPIVAMSKPRKRRGEPDIPRMDELEAMDSETLLRLVARTSVSLSRLVGVERLTRGEATEIVKGDVTHTIRPLPDEQRLKSVFKALEEAGMTMPSLPAGTVDLPSDEVVDDGA